MKLTFKPWADDSDPITVQGSDLALAFMELAEAIQLRYNTNIWEDYDFIHALTQLAAGETHYERTDFSTPEDDWTLNLEKTLTAQIK